MTSSFEQMRANVGKLLRGIDRYNPENLATLERYVETQARENAYDLEANLAVLKLYQFNPAYFQTQVTSQILLKALTNLPHTDFTLCKCMIDQTHQEERPIRQILYLGNLLETCHFQSFWTSLEENRELIDGITGFEDSVRKYTQVKVWMNKYGWTENDEGQIFIFNQEESVKPKNIVEKIDFESECCHRNPSHISHRVFYLFLYLDVKAEYSHTSLIVFLFTGVSSIMATSQ
uniref:Eukaryotic translation initiation factor 3 subunit K n=1 Tax=Dicentrarchus labrax TaxID=13489 RepID=A0A8P4KMQ6_DICLA